MISVLIVLVIVGVILYVVNAAIPMEHWVRVLINALVAIFVLLWLLNALGIDTGVHLRVR